MEANATRKERPRAIPRDKLPENKLIIRSWTSKGKTYKLPNVWYDLDNKEFLTYDSRFGLHVIKPFNRDYGVSVYVRDSEGITHSISTRVLIEQNSQK